MLVFVDYEHGDRYALEGAERIQAARTWITYRLEDVSGKPCMLVRYDRVTEKLLEQIGAEAIFISGNATTPSRYDEASLLPLQQIVRTTRLPIFGFCGGFQFIANALGAAVVPIEVTDADALSERVREFPGGRFGELGYHAVELLADHELLDGFGDAPVFRHAHGLHVPKPPANFRALAKTAVTPVQLAVDNQRHIAGSQFHPEYWTDEHPEGRTLIANFLRWSGLLARS